MADISKKIDKAIREMEVPASLDTAIIKVKKITDELKKGDKTKRAAGLKSGGRAGYKYGKSVKKKSFGKAIRGKGCEIR